MIATSSGQDPSEFKITLPHPLDFDDTWKVAITGIKIPEKILLLTSGRDYIRVIADSRLEASDRHKQLVRKFEDVWLSQTNSHSLTSVLKKYDMTIDQIGLASTRVTRSLTELVHFSTSKHRTYRTFDMSLNSNVHVSPYKVLADQLSKTLTKASVSSRYFFDEMTRKGIFIVGDDEWIGLSGELSYMMSLPNLMRPGQTYESEYCVDIFQNHRTIYVYSDLGKEVIMGEGNHPFLQSFSIGGSGDENRGIINYVEFHKPIFLPLQKHHITSINFSIRNSVGEKLKFSSSSPTTVCKLLFKRFDEV